MIYRLMILRFVAIMIPYVFVLDSHSNGAQII